MLYHWSPTTSQPRLEVDLVVQRMIQQASPAVGIGSLEGTKGVVVPRIQTVTRVATPIELTPTCE